MCNTFLFIFQEIPSQFLDVFPAGTSFKNIKHLFQQIKIGNNYCISYHDHQSVHSPLPFIFSVLYFERFGSSL